jgi:hypothetical protein
MIILVKSQWTADIGQAYFQVSIKSNNVVGLTHGSRPTTLRVDPRIKRRMHEILPAQGHFKRPRIENVT